MPLLFSKFGDEFGMVGGVRHDIFYIRNFTNSGISVVCKVSDVENAKVGFFLREFCAMRLCVNCEVCELLRFDS